MISGKKILVTGGAGFIGSNLCQALLQMGNRVVCLDNFATGRPENLAEFEADSSFELIEGDIRCQDTCRQAVKGVDYVLHQAALGSVPRSVKDPLTSNEVNVTGFLNMLIAARDEGVKRMVYASSSSVYGESKELPKVEERTGKLLSPYAVTKYVNELYADVFTKTYGMELIGLRYFNVFGKRQDPDGPYAAVIPLFVKQLMAHQRPVINGDGEYSRDFTYIDNVVQMNIRSLVSDDPRSVNTVYNVAYGERATLNRLLSCLKGLLADYDPQIAGIEPLYGPVRAGDIPHSLADISKARTLVGYAPQYGLEEGLRLAVDWYWHNLKQ